MEKLKELVSTCVLGGVMFEGQLGTQAYSVQDLVHSVNLESIESMWKRTKTQVAALETDSLFKTRTSSKKVALELKVEVLEAVFHYKHDRQQAARQREVLKKEAAERIAVLKEIKTTKEYDAMGKKSVAALDKEISELESLVVS